MLNATLIKYIDNNELAIVDASTKVERDHIVLKENCYSGSCGPETRTGDKIIYFGFNGYDYDRKFAEDKGIKLLEEFEVSSVDVSNWHTTLYLKGFESGFNSVMFCKL